MADSVRRQIRDGVTEGEQVPVVCLLDSVDTTASLQILKHFLSGLCENISRGRAQAKGIVTVAIEQPYEVLVDDSISCKNDASSVEWFQVIDCYNDPLGWGDSAEDGADNFTSSMPLVCSAVVSDIRDLERLRVSILQRGTASLGHQTSERFAVLVDSFWTEDQLYPLILRPQSRHVPDGTDVVTTSSPILLDIEIQVSPLFRFHSLPVLTNFLDGLRSHEQVSVILFLVHADLLETRVVSALEYFATTIIFVTPSSEVSRDEVQYDAVDEGSLRIRQKRRNGRVREQIEGFHLGLSSVIFTPTVNVFPSQRGKSTVPKVQFNLELTEKERQDRANVILPFEHQGTGAEFKIYDGRESAQFPSSLPAAEKSSLPELPYSQHGASEVKMFGEIHYIRDSDDERPDSDEDPDDDLDI